GRAVPGLRLPEGFRPGTGSAGGAVAHDDVGELRAAGLLVEDGERVALCPLTTGLLRLFDAPAVRVTLRVHEPVGDGVRRWLTDAAASGGIATRLTRVTLRDASGLVRDAEPVELAGHPVAHLPADVAACV